MKKIMLVSLMFTAAFGLAACGKKGDVNPPASQSTR